MIVRETFDNGLRLLTEAMPHVRSISLGVWLARGSRHEDPAQSGISHFIEHMLFKGSTTRSAQEIAQAIDSIGGQVDAFTAKEYAGYYVKVLDAHLGAALDILSDLVLHPAFREEEIEREKKVVLEEIKMVEDTPDDLVHELFTQQFWTDHALGRPILGVPDTVSAFTSSALQTFFEEAYVAPNVIISAAGNLDHARLRGLVAESFAELPAHGAPVSWVQPDAAPQLQIRDKELEQSHLCLGSAAYPQDHPDRFISYLMNTMLGDSMSSRLFQHIREERGLAYAVFSGLTAYRDTGALTVYAGCASDSVEQVLELVVAEMRNLAGTAVPTEELQRAKDHLKGSLMLSLENTASRMSHLARQELYFGEQSDLDEILESIDRVTVEDVQRVGRDLLADGPRAVTVLGPSAGLDLSAEQLGVAVASTVE
ncbi:MAG: pitrilysin family protein [Vicinamibacterales bacterium]|nr:pitrilysin family protein [Vicinamibacterales bacterium]